VTSEIHLLRPLLKIKSVTFYKVFAPKALLTFSLFGRFKENKI